MWERKFLRQLLWIISRVSPGRPPSKNYGLRPSEPGGIQHEQEGTLMFLKRDACKTEKNNIIQIYWNENEVLYTKKTPMKLSTWKIQVFLVMWVIHWCRCVVNKNMWSPQQSWYVTSFLLYAEPPITWTLWTFACCECVRPKNVLLHSSYVKDKLRTTFGPKVIWTFSRLHVLSCFSHTDH